MSDAFLSIVEPPQGSDKLLVRARRKGDIEKVFPGVKVDRTPGRDYLYRALVDREVVAEKMAEQVRSIAYGNFKNSVKNNKLHKAYSRFWHVMADVQELPPYSSTRGRGQGSLL